jgi:hypothetical protein
MAGFVNRDESTTERPTPASRNIVSKALKALSSFGMMYDDMVLKNSKAIGINEDRYGWSLDPRNVAGGEYDDYALFANLSMTDINLRKSISIFDKSYPKKREDLRKFAIQDEIEEILDTLCDEAIVYDDKNYFCDPLAFDDETLEPGTLDAIKMALETNFKRVYQYFGFNNDIAAWSYFRKWLVDGYLAFEIIYNKDQSRIIGFKELDPIYLEPGLDKEGKKIWKQFKGQPNKERVIYDSQVIYISYANVNTVNRVSYVERLVRSFNLLRIMEHSRVIWATVNASFKTKFVIPVGGKSKTRAKQSLGVLMQNYREQIDFDTDSGELKVNGKPMMPFNKEYWLPSGDAGEPTIETIGNDGPDLSDTDALKYFREKLIKVSKIPLSRFDMESPPSWEMNAEGMTRDEIKFGRFITRLRSVFQEIIVKPLWIQMCLDFPELKEDDAFKAQIGIKYRQYNIFEEMKEIEILQKRLDFVTSMKDGLVETDANMNEIKFFSSQFLIQRFLGLSAEDLRLNKKLKEIEDEESLAKAKKDAEATGMA